MKSVILILALTFIGFSMNINSEEPKSTIYDFTVKSIDGKDVKLSEYKGKYVLIVNTASKCGLTPQYKGLEELYQKYKNKNFVILGFPCNQFAGQEPGTNSEIKEFCQLNYGVSFPMFDKIDVNGDNAAPLYKFLKSSVKGFIGDSIKWNFTKFLVDENGKPIARYSPQTKPDSIGKDLAKLLNN